MVSGKVYYPHWWSVQRCSLTLVVSGEFPPWWLVEKCTSLNWWSFENCFLALAVSGELPPYIGGHWRSDPLHWSSVEKCSLTLVVSEVVLPFVVSGEILPPLLKLLVVGEVLYLDSQKGSLATPMYEKICGLPLQISFLNAS